MSRPGWLLATVLLIAIVRPAIAQGKATDSALTVAQGIDAWVAITEQHLVPLAEAMPEEKYSFAPSGGEFKNVRTFGEQLKHLAANNFYQAAIILGEKPPEGTKEETGPESVKTKAQIVAYLKRSFEALHHAVSTINQDNLGEPIPGTSGSWQRNRVARVVDAIAHSFDHYGQLVEYLRMNRIVPPASR